MECDKIVTPEAMGIPLATALSLKTNIPFVIIRKKKYGLDGEREVAQTTGYSKNAMYINGLRKGDRVLFVDDVVSTGGTLIPMINTLKEMGVIVKDVVIVFNKHKNIRALEEKIGLRIKTLLSVDVENGRVVIL